MLEAIKKHWPPRITVALFVVGVIWWVGLKLTVEPDHIQNQVFAAVYGVMALLGGIWGIVSARAWGGWKSVMGKAIYLLSFGLLAQEFGQLTYSYYIYFQHIEVPYPSIGDIGYFGSIIFYIFAVFYLGKATGSGVTLRAFRNKIQAVLIPVVLLIASYFAFLRGYEFDWSAPLTVFLDFGYPFGQALYLALAISIYLFSRKVLGGVMKKPTIFLLFALVFQYFSDYVFLYQANRGIWYAGGVNDFMYFVSYTLMAFGLIQLGVMAARLRRPTKDKKGS